MATPSFLKHFNRLLLLGLVVGILGPEVARAQAFHLAGDLDYAGAIDDEQLDVGGGGGLRVGSQLDLVLATLILEVGGHVHRFDDINVWRGTGGARLRVGAILEPGIFAHVGVGHISGERSRTDPTLDGGVSLDLTLLPLIDIGAHVAYNSVLGSGGQDGFQWITAGLHAALSL